MRINKYVAICSPLSRRAADTAVLDGRVTVNGHTAEQGMEVGEADVVTLDGKVLRPVVQKTTIIFHKPVGYVCSRNGQGNRTIYDILPAAYQQLNPVGRLDKDSSGLLLLTNDGQFAEQLTHPRYVKTKIYEVTLDKPLEPLHQQMISDHGIALFDGPSRFLIIKIDSHAKRGRERTASGGVEAASERSNGGTLRGREQPVAVRKATCRASCACQRAVAGPRNVVGPSSEMEKSPTIYQITMTEGRNRQIRRTFAALGYTVTTLHRTHFGPYALNTLEPGQVTTV